MQEIQSWLPISTDSDFSIYNLPFGIFLERVGSKRAGIALGDKVIDLDLLHELGFFKEINLPNEIFRKEVLNDFIALGKPITNAVRLRVQSLFTAGNTEIQGQSELLSKLLIPIKSVRMCMPVRVPNYTDFYSSREHATNVGTMFRDPENALLPNWLHLPVGYHGRASSIIPSGVPIHRPKGQFKDPNKANPEFGPSKRLDFELEMAFITGKATEMGRSISPENVEDHIFGFVLFNDWSARDIQQWEYVPLGPFLAKNFASSISPWIVTLEALVPFRVEGPAQEPEVLPYLKTTGAKNFDIHLEVSIMPDEFDETKVCRSNSRYLYWNVNQQLAHHTINGCNIEVGDMYASGTISGPDPDSYGSMLELAWKGTKPLVLSDGKSRTFIEDGDTVIMRGHAQKDGIRVGFGEVSTQVLPAKL
jgi:fumarylacetoacetase